MDSYSQVEHLVQQIAPTNAPFIDEGDADRVGTPIGTVPRLRKILLAIGYEADIKQVKEPGGIRLRINLIPFDRVRHIYVSGNRFFVFFSGLRQEEVIRQLNIRPGQKLPSKGKERDEFLITEANRVREYLRDQGYWDAQVQIDTNEIGSLPAEVNLTVRMNLGEGYPLRALTVAGNRIVPTEEIEDSFKHTFLRLKTLPFRRAVLRKDIAKLSKTYRDLGFPGVRIRDDFDPSTSLDRERKEVRLGIDIKERRKLEVAFEGNRSRSSSALLDDVTFFTRGSYDDVEADLSRATLERAYRDRGHMLVKVKWRRERLGPDSDRIIFTIDEGPELRVRVVEFWGNQSIHSEELGDAIRTRPFPFLGAIGLGNGGYASIRQISLDVESLREHYVAEGYLDAKVRAEIGHSPNQWMPLPKISFTEQEELPWRASKEIRVRFLIEEGPVFWVSSMQFDLDETSSYLPRDDDFLRSLLRTQLGGPFRESLIKRDENRLVRQFGDDGYRNALVEAHTTRHANQVQVVWKIKLGPRIRVGPIFLRGNFHTRDSTILTWTELRTGDVLTTRGAERAQRNLALTELFNNPNPISYPSESRSDSIIPMVIEVEERHDHFGVVSVGIAASTDQAAPSSTFPLGGAAILGYQHRNLAGLGWRLSSQFEYGPSKTSESASILDPRVFGSLVRLEISQTYLRQATVRLGDIRSGGGSIAFSRELAPGLDATIRYSLRNTSRTEILERGAGPDQNQSTVRIGTVVGTMGVSAEWDRLDNLLVPSKGFKVNGGVELATPAFSFDSGEDSFIKVFARSLTVVPILKWLSVRHSVRYDQGFPLSGASILPKVERYYAGGDTTIRGFQLDRALTEWVSTSVVPGVTLVRPRPLGGNLRVLHNLDLQFPISAPLYGSVFLDSGVVAYSLEGLRASDFRHAVGFSPLLVKLPVGDLSFSFAIPLDRKPGDDQWRLHFNVGLMF